MKKKSLLKKKNNPHIRILLGIGVLTAVIFLVYIASCFFLLKKTIVFHNYETRDYLLKRAKRGNAEAQFKYTIKYCSTNIGNNQTAVGIKWLTLSAENGYAMAQFALGHSYLYGDDVEQNTELGYKWLKIAASKRYPPAIAYCYIKGIGVEPDKKRALEELIKGAKNGYVEAQFILGMLYKEDRNFPITPEPFDELYVLKDNNQLLYWWHLAGESGFYPTQIGLAEYYYESGNAKESTKWLRKAAEQGFMDIQYELAERYLRGEGVDTDMKEAVKWYREAAEQGHAAAQYCLGRCYEIGEGVDTDMKETVKWYREAAEQGHAAAEYCLGRYYEIGVGVEKSRAEAIMWYREAANHGYKPANEALRKLGAL